MHQSAAIQVATTTTTIKTTTAHILEYITNPSHDIAHCTTLEMTWMSA